MRKIAMTGGSGFIGTNLIEKLLSNGIDEILSLDFNPPKLPEHKGLWMKCDILDPKSVQDGLEAFQPTHVIHLAARTDMEGKTVDDYAANHIGTRNVVAAVQQLPSVERVVFTSSQYVVGPGPLPTNDLEFRPHTIYGESKVQSEKAVRAAVLSCVWTIIRPTNVWGKWHPRYPTEFWRVLKQGRYVHPGRKQVLRSYAYVGTVIQQIFTILDAPAAIVDRQVFYVGDETIDLWEWTNGFSLALRGRAVLVVPRPIVRGIARVGDVVIALGGRFPLFSSRYRSMTEDYATPMQRTFDRLGMPELKLADGIEETVSWLKSQGEFWR